LLRDIHHGPHLALLLQLLASDRQSLDQQFVRDALSTDASPLLRPNHAVVAVATVLFTLVFVVAGLAHRTTLMPITYGANDPIAPNGQRRLLPDIVAFMERDVMPFARRALAPVVGGADKVQCETCHGDDAPERRWKMPGVRVLPDPVFELAGMERAGFWLDPQ